MAPSTTYVPTPAQTRFIAGAVAAYAAADKTGRTAIRRALTAGGARRVDAMDAVGAKTYQTAIARLTAPATPATVDHEVTLADRIATLRLAADLMESGIVAPSGLDPVAYPAARGVANVATAFDLAGAKITRNGPTQSVQTVIDAAFDGVESGTFLRVSEICNRADYPHSGAVAARLFPAKGDCTLTGVTPVAATADTPKGARKI